MPTFHELSDQARAEQLHEQRHRDDRYLIFFPREVKSEELRLLLETMVRALPDVVVLASVMPDERQTQVYGLGQLSEDKSSLADLILDVYMTPGGQHVEAVYTTLSPTQFRDVVALLPDGEHKDLCRKMILEHHLGLNFIGRLRDGFIERGHIFTENTVSVLRHPQATMSFDDADKVLQVVASEMQMELTISDTPQATAQFFYCESVQSQHWVPWKPVTLKMPLIIRRDKQTGTVEIATTLTEAAFHAMIENVQDPAAKSLLQGFEFVGTKVFPETPDDTDYKQLGYCALGGLTVIGVGLYAASNSLNNWWESTGSGYTPLSDALFGPQNH